MTGVGRWLIDRHARITKARNEQYHNPSQEQQLSSYPQSEHSRAVNAGMTPAEAARWLAFVAKHDGAPPITVEEAARQCREVRPS